MDTKDTTPREPDEGPSTRHGAARSKLSGICTAITLRFTPLPSSKVAMYSRPGTRPCAALALPAVSTLGPYSVPKPPPRVASTRPR